MPVHDWTRVDAGIFHDFHLGWIAAIKKALNTGLLPKDYYALCEQHAAWTINDLLNAIPPGQRTPTESPSTAYRELRRSLTIRHVRGHRLIALLELVSSVNKTCSHDVEEFANKAVCALKAGIPVLFVDLFPPGPHDPQGMRGVIWHGLAAFDKSFDVPANYPLTLTSFKGPLASAYSAHVVVGGVLPDIPLVLWPDHSINLPLEATYQKAYSGVASFWRDVLEGRSANP
jgi:hypothetical protein